MAAAPGASWVPLTCLAMEKSAAPRRLALLLRHVAAPASPAAAASATPLPAGGGVVGRPFSWPELLPDLLLDAPVPRFDARTEADAARGFLAAEGFVVFKSVLSSSEVARALGLIWDSLEGLNRGIDRADPQTWASRPRRGEDTGRGWPWGDHGQGLISAGMEEFGFTHSEACWFVRGVPAVRDAFATVLGTDELEVSFDGLSLFRCVALHCITSSNAVFFLLGMQCPPARSI